ncbi:MAG: nitrophenyl compound nitroreductase subunit ArsF family protein [Bacteroidales bacterium]|nr:nitrophenyl compound nitroreductase subunit ArsF family protein [Bacteroidales bacterium]MDD4030981.1 nitrophenyl compound nitroreductase subunit ArsF family protein [Bacteroidales bacterium]MDD4435744.1 nitrophenyl compound nitroreductase subunit ArsF family protein [Bacteroidales bacterium]
MKKVFVLLACSFIALTTVAEEKNDLSGIEVYYFHYSRRCVTCQAVEAVAQDALIDFYEGRIALKSVNLDDKANNDLAKKLGVKGQSLLIVKGDKKIDLTNEGFLNARSNPDKFASKIKETIDALE